MRAFALVVIAGCGGSSSHTDTLQGWQHSYSVVHDRHQKSCDIGNDQQCYLYGAELVNVRVEFKDDHPDWQVPWSIDRAGAKTALIKSCASSMNHKYRHDACELLLSQKLVTPEEGLAMCTVDDEPPMAMCSAVSKVGSFDEHQWYQLCSHTAFLCEKAMPHLTDPGDKAFADMGIKFEEVSVKITGYAAHFGVSDDDDDDDDDSGGGGGGASTSSDSSCHKDTDCKGDRICQGGSCVDAGTKAAKPASLGVAECDQLAQMIETQVFSCSNLSDQPLHDAYQAYKDAWGKVDAGRRKSMAPVCKEEIDRVDRNLYHVHCK